MLRQQLKSGYSYELNKELAIQGTYISLEMAQHQESQSQNSPYMCNWAYQLLRTERSSAALDFTRFRERFNAVFGRRPARCCDGQPCDGRNPENCKRFKGAKIRDQSAHDIVCTSETTCKRMYWDEVSYRSVEGARAVCIQSTDDNLFKYCQASSNTLAVSHVWSHGQGGRPENKLKNGDPGGMNTCLHRRFAALAQDVFDCDSYWMDTPCIPEDHSLREESIANINGVFANSRATLICDRDLMEIDVSELSNPQLTPSSLRVRESLLAVLLVCDWNVRAWTLLEAIRGRQNIHILCKDNAVVSLKEALSIVCYHGSIDIAVLYLTAQHLLPSPPYNKSTPMNLVTRGLVSLEEAGSLLSHRHASRDGDDIVIWSLLFNEKAYHSPEAMWRSRVQDEGDNGQYNLDINTGFLISSAPRIEGEDGLSWAPARAAVRTTGPSEGQKTYLAYSGADTSLAEVTPEGLKAAWLLHKFPGAKGAQLSSNENKVLGRIQNSYIRDYKYGALLQPLSLDRWGNISPARYEGNANGPIYAVCSSDTGDGSDWKWRGVFEWDVDVSLPRFESEIILIA
jgi:hypothetical protein